MKALKPPVRWSKSRWSEEDISFFYEADEDGWALRQVELHGPELVPMCAAALAELPEAMTDGLRAVQEYESKYGVLAEVPLPIGSAEFPDEEISQVEFEEVWIRARAHIELHHRDDEDG